ncbi:MAG: cytochrome P450 [Herpetosiphonaceae bacterium]|nr:cytochrome P450 [Herpetosiphonaceae bacterium]
MFPYDPIAAVTAPDPYPCYAELVARGGIYRDDTLGLWIAASADAVTAVLSSAFCRVRPVDEPIPRALLGSSAADIFRYLVRMNDGRSHCSLKQAVSATCASIEAGEVAKRSKLWARVLIDELRPLDDHTRLSDFAFRLPVYVIGDLLGVPHIMLPLAAASVSAFVRCLVPASSPEQLEEGNVAAMTLLDLFHAGVDQGCYSDGLLAVLVQEAQRVGYDDPTISVANAIGLLVQAHEATAGLIGNTLVALATRQELREQVMDDLTLLDPVIQEVLRYDPPVQNTRRFVAQNGQIAGQELHVGDTVLVLLAAANRDRRANPNPDRFELWRNDRRIFTFGLGAHGCPGTALAQTIARSGVEQLMLAGLDVEQLAEKVMYRAATNTRIPLFGAHGGNR